MNSLLQRRWLVGPKVQFMRGEAGARKVFCARPRDQDRD
jgi:hypothetical protein